VRRPVSRNGMVRGCGVHKGKPSLEATAILIASSSSLMPLDAIDHGKKPVAAMR